MPFNRPTLEAAIRASGGYQQSDDQIEPLLAKLTGLEQTGRYTQLINSLAAANDKSNFLALLLEATFAHQFESAGIPLAYEVQAEEGQATSIDFMLKAESGETVYFELRLLQQDQATADDIAEQLTVDNSFAIMKDGDDEQAAVLRLQGVLLSKVQDKKGKPIKFLQSGPGILNIVVVCISDILFGTADVFDCLLAAYGDPEEVPNEFSLLAFKS